jgi:hypothetical protein
LCCSCLNQDFTNGVAPQTVKGFPKVSHSHDMGNSLNNEFLQSVAMFFIKLKALSASVELTTKTFIIFLFLVFGKSISQVSKTI